MKEIIWKSRMLKCWTNMIGNGLNDLEDNNKTIMARQEANKKLLEELEWFIDSYPDQRFGQILCNYFFPKYQTIDPFFDEPTDTLAEVDRAKKCAILDTIALIGVLSEEELEHAKTLSTLEAVKYIKSIVPSFDLNDLYIREDNKETEGDVDMLTEDYVSFETAKLLKEKGFNCDEISCIRVFKGHTYKIQGTVIDADEDVTIPTIQLAMKWLREIHQLHIGILVAYNYFPRRYRYHIMHTENVETYSQNDFDTYEQACEEAIKYCLENLI